MINRTQLVAVFFLCVAICSVSFAQSDSIPSTSSANIADTFINVTAATSNKHYKYYSSEKLFQQALKGKIFTGVSVVSISDTLSGIFRKKTGVVAANKITVPFDYDSIQYISDTTFICRRHLVARRFYACYYYIYNTNTKKPVDFTASAIQYIGNNLFVIRAKGSKFFYNNKTGKTSPHFDSYSTYDSLFILIQTASEYKLLDRNANTFIDTPFKVLLKSNDTVYNAALYDSWDIYKNTGEQTFKHLNCDSIRVSSEQYCWDFFRNGSPYHRRAIPSAPPAAKTEPAKTYGPVTLIDKFHYDTLKLMIHFDTIYYQSENWLMYKKAGQYGYCDTTGNIRIAHQYDTITSWSDNMAAIRMKNKWGYITRREQLTVQPYYVKALPFNNGVAAVFDGKRWMFITKDGKNINSLTFDSIQQTASGKWYIYNKGFMGLCDVTGRELIPAQYEFLLDANSDVFVYKQGFLYGLIAKDRTILCKPVYDQFIYDTTNNYYLLKHISESALLFVIHSSH